ncbi:YrhB domain-containing protein [Streptomyces sp. SL13]|uniref:YrhB domain-containing protein n=1 Tax=Streptantibioticus silvisoli TaxID=2705255 RepID=A0AA90H585_9ACTN|nr:YrhB domain-containing protein [Streptantibioticus silvisoli]MDI5971065.1 YrhB domain-containing protein [Streptantibioticus silvisoli]
MAHVGPPGRGGAQPAVGDKQFANGWLFACNTPEFLRSGDWREGMPDAALVVPEDHRRPFGLPNADLWGWLP